MTHRNDGPSKRPSILMPAALFCYITSVASVFLALRSAYMDNVSRSLWYVADSMALLVTAIVLTLKAKP